MPRRRPPVSDDDAPALAAFVRLLSPGYETYQVACARCHGDEGIPPAGGSRVATVTLDRAYFAAHDGRYLRAKVWHMLGDAPPEVMPHFERVLSEAEARAVVEYLRVLPGD